MNPLRIILTIVLIIYLSIYQFQYWKYFFLFVIPYYIITQVMMFDPKINSPKKKALISMWSHPSDPQVYATMKLNITKTEEFLREYSQKTGTKIGFTVLLMKVMARMLEKFPQVNGNVIFGKFVSKTNVDISCLVAADGGVETEMITIKDCDKISLEEVSKKVQEKKEALDKGSNKTHNKILLFAKLLPSFLLSPFLRIISYLSVCGCDLSWLWLPKYAYGTCIVTNVGKLGIDHVYLPIPPYTYAPLIISTTRKKKKLDVDSADMTLKESTFINLQFTIDHRYMDGAQAAKIAAEIEKHIGDPSLLLSA